MQFAMQACVQGRAMPGLGAFKVHGATVARASAQIGPLPVVVTEKTAGVRSFACGGALSSSSSSRFIAPGLDALQLSLKRSHHCYGWSLGSARAEAGPGAYDRDTFVDPKEAAKIAHVAKRLERTAGQFKRLGSLGFWGQLVCTLVAAVILAFSVVITGQPTAPVSVYLTAGGIACAFLSVFWSFGYIRLAQKLRDTIGNPTKAPPRAQVVKNLRNGIIINLLGMGSTLLGLQATVGVLVAKALTSSSTPYLQGAPQGYSPVLALDVFLVQASGNAILSHFLGLVFSLQLLRSVTLSQPSSDTLKVATTSA